MSQYASPSASTDRVRRLSPRPRSSLRVRNVAAGVIYHLVFEGNVQRLSGQQLRQHLTRISRVPAAAQQLFVHGRPFAVHATGAAVGLQEDDVVDLVQAAEDGGGVVHDDGRRSGAAPATGRSMGATASSLRPSTDAGTLSPEVPRERPSRYPDDTASAARPLHSGGGGRDGASALRTSSASMASTATASTRRAPTPERLVSSYSGGVRAPPAPSSTHDSRTRAAHNESNMPLWTSATTLSSLPSNPWAAGVGVSPPPQRPAPPMRGAAVPGHASQWGADRLRPSYEVTSPPPPPPPPPTSAHPQHLHHYPSHVKDAAATTGLNHSYDPASGAAPDRPRSSVRRPHPPTTYRHVSRGPSPTSPGYTPNGEVGGDAYGVAVPAADVVISADELETLLDEQNYVWQMEAYRFRTERQNRLTALQHRQRELTFEAARYDQAVADVERQLGRERRKLAELQHAMSHNTSTLAVPSPWEAAPAMPDAIAGSAYGGDRGAYGYAHVTGPSVDGQDDESEEDVLVDGY